MCHEAYRQRRRLGFWLETWSRCHSCLSSPPSVCRGSCKIVLSECIYLFPHRAPRRTMMTPFSLLYSPVNHSLLVAGNGLRTLLNLHAIFAAPILIVCFLFHAYLPVKNRAAARLLQHQRRYPDAGNWPTRGWLTMLRAREQRFLARPAKGWMATCRKPGQEKGRWKIRKLPPPSLEVAFYNYVGSLAESACFVSPKKATVTELLEEGQLDKNFVWAVETVAELHEEELFRHVVTFL